MIPVIITRITDDNAYKIAMTIDMVIYLLFFLQNTQGLDNNAGNDYSKIGKCRLYISLKSMLERWDDYLLYIVVTINNANDGTKRILSASISARQILLTIMGQSYLTGITTISRHPRHDVKCTDTVNQSKTNTIR